MIGSRMNRAETDSIRAGRRCGLYVHVPFCETKCGYCDFYSVALKDRETAPLVERLLRELRSRVADAQGRGYEIKTAFCGGGTPTLLPVDQLAALLRAIGELVAVHHLEEFTVEANPATVDDAKAQLLVQSGVTRVSMGVQSFFPDELTVLERLHSPADIAPSVATLRRHGIGQINLDLIFGIPGQSLDSWRESLRRAIDLAPDHIACYGLTYEPNTRLTAQRHAGRVMPCAENLEAEMFLLTADTLAGVGYHQYETSNFTRPGRESRHNLIYWRNEPYIGVGPSAAGCLDHRRYKNVADIAGYIRLIDQQGHAETESETLTNEMLMIEMVMMQLRVTPGLSIASFRERTGVDPLALFHDQLIPLTDQDLITLTGEHITLTRAGRLLGDAVIRELTSACGSSTISLPIVN